MDSLTNTILEYVVELNGRMPKSEAEWNDTLDLINHAREYQEAFSIEQTGISKAMMKKLGFKTTEEIKSEWKRQNIFWN